MEATLTNIGRRRLGVLVSGQPMDIFFATRREWLSHSESLSRGWPNLSVRPEGQKPAVDASGRLFFVQNLPALNGLSDMEILVADPDTARRKNWIVISGSRLSSWLLMQPVLSPDGNSLAALLTDDQLRISGSSHDRRTVASHYRLWPPGYVHYPQSVMVVRWTLHLRRSGQGEADIVLLSI